MRVAVVNDLRIATEALRRALMMSPGIEIAWTAENGEQAVAKCCADRPDLILMDMIMPVMDGATATHHIMQRCPCPILITTASVQTNVDRVFEALGYGALDAIDTPVFAQNGELRGAENLGRRIRHVMRLVPSQSPPVEAEISRPRQAVCAPDRLAPLVVVGSSTGGPRVLRDILRDLPKPIPYAVVIVQHLAETFVPGLAQWLAREADMPVEVTIAGERPVAPQAYVAWTRDHLVLDACGRFRSVSKPEEAVHRPSIDVFFQSLIRESITPGVAVLLTGMGRDGSVALKNLRDTGWHTIAQDKATSVVWGMPRHAVKLNAATQVLPADQIAHSIHRTMSKRIRKPEA